jgi:hypothetical protein
MKAFHTTNVRHILVLAGIVLLVVLLLPLLLALPLASAQPADQTGQGQQADPLQEDLPPRPSVIPTAGPGGGSGSGGGPTPVPLGRITGTIIDLTTGAPVPAMPVQVGNVVVYSDEFGNYERPLLPSGDYRVELLLDPEVAVPQQDPRTVRIDGDETEVEHLFFIWLENAPPTPGPTPTLVPVESIPFQTTVVDPNVDTEILVGDVEIIIESRDITEPLTLQTRRVPQQIVPPPNDGGGFVNDPVEIIALDAAGNPREDVQFVGPIEIRFPGPTAEQAAGEEPTEQRLVFYFNEEADVWVNIPTVPNGDGTVSGFTRHITLFALD